MGLVVALVDELAHGTKFAPFVGPAVAGCLALYQCLGPIQEWYANRMSGYDCCKEVCFALTSAGASYVGALVGAASLAFTGPVGMIVGGMMGGWAGNKLCSWGLDIWHWACGTRSTERLLKTVLRFSEPALSHEILSALEGWGPFGWWKKQLTAGDFDRLKQQLGQHRKQAARDWHPDKAAHRGDSDEEKLEKNGWWVAYEDAHEQLLKNLCQVSGLTPTRGSSQSLSLRDL